MHGIRPSGQIPAFAYVNRRRLLILTVLAALAAGLLTLGTSTATAATPCWKRLVNDWYDGRIDRAYPVACYRQAIRNLPEDVRAYSDARDDITRALNAALRRGGVSAPDDVIEPAPRPANGGTTEETETEPAETTDGGSEAAPPGSGGDDDGILDVFKPSNADSIPLPLLILAGLALFLLALAGGGFVTRRIQERRVRLAPRPPDEL